MNRRKFWQAFLQHSDEQKRSANIWKWKKLEHCSELKGQRYILTKRTNNYKHDKAAVLVQQQPAAPAEFLLAGFTFFFWKLKYKIFPLSDFLGPQSFSRSSQLKSHQQFLKCWWPLIHYGKLQHRHQETGTIYLTHPFSVPLLLPLLSLEKAEGEPRPWQVISSLLRWWNKQCWKSFLGMWRTSNSWRVLSGSTDDSNTLSVWTSPHSSCRVLDTKTGVKKNPTNPQINIKPVSYSSSWT